MKRISFSDEAKADLRAIPQHMAMNILSALHRLAEDGSGDIKMLRDSGGEKGHAPDSERRCPQPFMFHYQ